MRGWATVATILTMTSICAATEIDVACERLSAEQADELRARIELLLRARDVLPQTILVACDAKRAWVVWNAPPAELLEVTDEGAMVEALIDAIERRATRVSGAPSEASRPANRPAPTSPHESPTWAARAPIEEGPRALVESGGIGLGLVTEILAKPLGPALGPRLDIGVGWGPWSLQLTESARFARSVGHGSALFYDLGAGFGWGAPFSRTQAFGAAVIVGGEWFNVEGHTVTTGFASLGTRGAIEAGPLSIALGLDGRLRFVPQYVGERVDVRVPRWSGLVFLEGVLLVEPAGRRRRNGPAREQLGHARARGAGPGPN